jgi:hypothetical protein
MANHEQNKTKNTAVDSNERAQEDNYDRGIVPAETAARREREGAAYKHLPEDGEITEQATDELAETGGYTVDKEGLVNAYAIEPEMYYEVPGDAREKEEEEKRQHAEDLMEAKQDKDGQLTMDGDKRGRGPGAI